MKTPALLWASPLPLLRPTADWDPCRGAGVLLLPSLAAGLSPKMGRLRQVLVQLLRLSPGDSGHRARAGALWAWLFLSADPSHSRSSFVGSLETIPITQALSPTVSLAQMKPCCPHSAPRLQNLPWLPVPYSEAWSWKSLSPGLSLES